MTPHNKKLLLLSGAIFLVSFIIFGIQFVAANLPAPRPKGNATFTPYIVEEKRRGEAVARCKYLKDKLRPWAESNQTQLREMLQAKLESVESRERLWATAPVLTVAKNGNINDRVIEKINISPSELDTPVRFMLFCGADRQEAAADLSIMDNDLVFQENQKKIRRVQELHKDFYWKKFRDVPWIETQLGAEFYALWISGRITRRSIIPNFNPRSPKLKVVQFLESAKFEEIEPPYDFVR